MQWLINILYEMVMANFAGTIVIWSGTIATIPDGWQLCDGTNGTPDLRDKFVVCAAEDREGVAKTHILPAWQQTGGTIEHYHSIYGGDYIGEEKPDYKAVTETAQHVPPFFALAYIMKV